MMNCSLKRGGLGNKAEAHMSDVSGVTSDSEQHFLRRRRHAWSNLLAVNTKS
jgi:hypothetical protein